MPGAPHHYQPTLEPVARHPQGGIMHGRGANTPALVVYHYDRVPDGATI